MVVLVGSGGGGGGRGVTKGFTCNTPQGSCRHVNVHVHTARTANTSAKLLNFEIILVALHARPI